jgi:cell division septum initiation protein DivIVA
VIVRAIRQQITALREKAESRRDAEASSAAANARALNAVSRNLRNRITSASIMTHSIFVHVHIPKRPPL